MNERVLHIGAAASLTGILNDPGVRTAPPVLLFNAGIVHRIGAHRLNVKIARALADNGITSLRFDLAGLGDSPPAPPGRSWEEQGAFDISAAMDALAAETGAQSFLAVGMCSGADHAYRAARADQRLTGIALLDPYAYANKNAARADFMARATSTARWARKMRSMLGRVEAAGSDQAWAVSDGDGDGGDQARPVPPRNAFGADLQHITERGAKILILYTGFVRAYVSKPAHFFETFSDFDFAGNIDVIVMPETDHTYTSLSAQDALLAHLTNWAGEFISSGAPS